MDRELVISSIRHIEKLIPQYIQLRREYLQYKQYIDDTKKELFKCTNKITRFHNRIKTPKDAPKVTFQLKQPWLQTLEKHIETQIAVFEECFADRERTEKIISDYLRLFKLTKNPKSERPTRVKPQCKNCSSSILPCTLHGNKAQHSSLYLNERTDRISETATIAVDVESYQCPEENGPQKKFRNRAFRVVAVLGTPSQPRGQTSYELLYHSFWRPTRSFRFYKPVTGIGDREVYKNMNKFHERTSAQEIFAKRIVKQRTLVMAAAKGDLQALELGIKPNVHDIQDYYCRYPTEPSKEPLSLKWPAKHVLLIDIQEEIPIETIMNPLKMR